jgi:hypothetical protein
VFGIVPHLTILAGIGQPHAQGQLAPRAVPLFNAMHWPVVPLAVLGLAAAGVLPPFWLVGALAWLSHIVVDWGFGNGPRTVMGTFVAGPSETDDRTKPGHLRRCDPARPRGARPRKVAAYTDHGIGPYLSAVVSLIP